MKGTAQFAVRSVHKNWGHQHLLMYQHGNLHANADHCLSNNLKIIKKLYISIIEGLIDNYKMSDDRRVA